MHQRFFSSSVLVLVAVACFAGDEAAKPLVKGDKIVFLGDSITAGGSSPKGYITLATKAITTAHPDFELTTVNAGISGHKVPNLQGRLDKDVLSKKPTIVFIYIGINDVWHWKKQPDGKMTGGTPKDKYEEGLKDLISRITQAGARALLCTPTVIGEKASGTNNSDAMLEEYCEISRKVATETKTPLVDLHKAFLDYLKANNPDNKERGILTADGVHLSDAGNKLVAEQMLKAVGEELK
ncbi:MAG: SGNH/GDSL hydrolase family protein [Planctomycetota bacterium]